MDRKAFLWRLGGLGAAALALPIVERFLAASPFSAAADSRAPESKLVKVRVFGPNNVLLPPTEMPRVVKTDAVWRGQLTPTQYQIARGKGTEPAFCGIFYDNHQTGVYHCVCCALPLFESGTKFDSGTGWPSFFRPITPENVKTHVDHSWGMDRTEILCTRCDGHLGHVFDDGPAPTGLRYCLNSASLTFVAQGHEVPEAGVKQPATTA